MTIPKPQTTHPNFLFLSWDEDKSEWKIVHYTYVFADAMKYFADHPDTICFKEYQSNAKAGREKVLARRAWRAKKADRGE